MLSWDSVTKVTLSVRGVQCDFSPLRSHCSEKATKVQDIKNNLKEAIEVRAWVCSRSAPPNPPPRQAELPLTPC